MALTKADKAARVDRLAHELESSTSAIVGTFEKLTVAQDFQLRAVVRGAGARYRVLKNKLAGRAAQGTKVEQALQGLKGVSSVAYTSGDPVMLAKALSTWVQENSQFTFKLGIVDGKLISIDEIKQLATMPGRDELFSKLLYLINAPAQRLATVINATGRDLAVVLNQGVEKQKFAGAAETQNVSAAPEAKGEEAAPATAGIPSQAEAASAEAPVEGAAMAEESKPEVGSEAAAGSQNNFVAEESKPVATPPSQAEAHAEPQAESPSQTEAASAEAPAER